MTDENAQLYFISLCGMHRPGLGGRQAQHLFAGAGTVQREALLIEHSPEAIDDWARSLRKRFGGRPVAIALELAKGPIVYALRKYDFIVLFPLNPATLAKYREVFTHSGAKDDPRDAQLALEFLLRYPDKLQPLDPQSAAMRALVQLVEMRRRLVDDQTSISNRITSALKNYFPQPLQWFPEKDSILFCDFLQRWPTLKALRQARRSTLERFFHEHNVRQARLIEQRIDTIKSAVALTDDEAGIQPFALLVTALVGQLRTTLHAIEAFDREIAVRAPAHPDFSIFESFPAAGPVFAPRLLSAFGEQRKRFPNPDDLQRYAGVAPVTERSGNSSWVHWRWQCPTFLRQTLVEWAALTSLAPSGRLRAIENNAAPANLTRRPCAHSPTSGSASFITAGTRAKPTTNPFISTHSNNAALHCSTS